MYKRRDRREGGRYLLKISSYNGLGVESARLVDTLLLIFKKTTYIKYDADTLY